MKEQHLLTDLLIEESRTHLQHQVAQRGETLTEAGEVILPVGRAIAYHIHEADGTAVGYATFPQDDPDNWRIFGRFYPAT